MNNLHRKLAPISSVAWEQIEAEAKRTLKLRLAGRKLVDFSGPLGADAASVNLGRSEDLRTGPVPGVTASRRTVQPLVELRAAFELSRDELDAIERGCKDPDLAPVVEAAIRIAQAEDNAIFEGYAAGGITGINAASAHEAVKLSDDYELYPRSAAEATRLMRIAGVDGPYAIALGPRCYTGLVQATASGGYPILELVRRVIDGPVILAPAVDGAVVVSQRGGDFELTVGQDLSIGYESHTEKNVRLYLTETLTFRVLTPEAGVALKYKSAKASDGGGGKKAKRR
jgi:uncharacterized linocin/CFP29 family protein